MKDCIRYRVLQNCELIQQGKTIREIAAITGYSRSTVHIDVSKRIHFINEILAEDIAKILSVNFSTKYIRGGLATKLKFDLARRK